MHTSTVPCIGKLWGWLVLPTLEPSLAFLPCPSEIHVTFLEISEWSSLCIYKTLSMISHVVYASYCFNSLI